MTPRPRSRHRELTDFLAFALAIVFLVRTFVGEPYGIPTGSMAPTLLGAHKLIRCLACGKEFSVGVLDGPPPVVCRCPACETKLDIADAPTKAGNRIIVLKGPPKPLKRWDVAVFKFIDEPRKLYVKRIVGLPGERLGIKAGEIEIWNENEQRWRIARKPAELAKELAIPVWEQAYQMEGQSGAWTATPPASLKRIDQRWIVDGDQDEGTVLTFHPRQASGAAKLVGDELGYNLGLASSQSANAESYWNKASNPVGDLHVCFTATNEALIDVDLRSGKKTYKLRIDNSEWQLWVDRRCVKSLGMRHYGERFEVHFASVDRRLAVWLDHRLIGEWDDDELGDSFPVSTDFEPVRIVVGSAKTKTEITNLRVLRDIYYSQDVGLVDFLPDGSGRDLMGNVRQFKRFRDGRKRTKEFAIGPNQYFALGDNSEQSLDGRHWKHGHFVDERMIVGRVLFKLGR